MEQQDNSKRYIIILPQHTLYPEELISYGTLAGNAGSINNSYSLVRYLDLNASAEQQGKLYLDYQRIYNH